MERLDEKRVFVLVCFLWFSLTIAFAFLVHLPLMEEVEEIRRETGLVS